MSSVAGAPTGPGDVIGGFVIEAIAGRGGMGVVYRARQKRPDRVVALKVIAPGLAEDPAFRARFEREPARPPHGSHILPRIAFPAFTSRRLVSHDDDSAGPDRASPTQGK